MNKKLKIDIIDYLSLKEITHTDIKQRGFIALDACPFCDGKRKCYVNVDPELSSGQYFDGFTNCYSCGKKGGFELVVSEVEDINIKEARKRIYHQFRKKDRSLYDLESISFDEVREKSAPEKFSYRKHYEEAREINLPPLSVDAMKVKGAKEYLLSRGLKEEDFSSINAVALPYETRFDYLRALHEKGFITKETMEFFYLPWEQRAQNETPRTNEIEGYLRLVGRVIFVVLLEDKKVGYVARDYTGNLNIKVLNSSGPLTSDYFYNFNNVKQCDHLILVEGIFDSFKTGLGRTLPLLGKSIEDRQKRMELLKLISPQEVTVLLDVGAEDEAMELCLRLSRFIPKVNINYLSPLLKLDLTSEEMSFMNKMTLKVEKKGEFIHMVYEDYLIFRMMNQYIKFVTKSRHKSKALAQLRSLSTYTDKDIERFKMILKMASTNKDLFVALTEKIKNSSYLDLNDLSQEEVDKLIESRVLYNLI